MYCDDNLHLRKTVSFSRFFSSISSSSNQPNHRGSPHFFIRHLFRYEMTNPALYKRSPFDPSEAKNMEESASVLVLLSLFLLPSHCHEMFMKDESSIPPSDVDLLEFPLNLEFLEAEFFLFGSLGYGLDKVAPNLVMGGPPPIGAKMAKLDRLAKDLITQFAFQEVGHLRAITSTVKGFPRPLLNLSSAAFSKVMDSAFGRPLRPPFDPYANGLNFLLASYVVPYVGLTGYVGANPNLQSPVSKKLVAGLLGVESGQDAVIRALLYEYSYVMVKPYGISVAEFTSRISNLRNRLGHSGLKDEGLMVPRVVGAETRMVGNVLAGDQFSLSYARTPEEILRIVYGSGDERLPGGFFPSGANGRIARAHLSNKTVDS